MVGEVGISQRPGIRENATHRDQSAMVPAGGAQAERRVSGAVDFSRAGVVPGTAEERIPVRGTGGLWQDWRSCPGRAKGEQGELAGPADCRRPGALSHLPDAAEALTFPLKGWRWRPRLRGCPSRVVWRKIEA